MCPKHRSPPTESKTAAQNPINNSPKSHFSTYLWGSGTTSRANCIMPSLSEVADWATKLNMPVMGLTASGGSLMVQGAQVSGLLGGSGGLNK